MKQLIPVVVLFAFTACVPKLIKEADKALEDGDYKKASELYKQYTDKN
jgi:hypothetical protein